MTRPYVHTPGPDSDPTAVACAVIVALVILILVAGGVIGFFIGAGT